MTRKESEGEESSSVEQTKKGVSKEQFGRAALQRLKITKARE